MDESLVISTCTASTVFKESAHSFCKVATASWPLSRERLPRNTWYGLLDCKRAFTISYPMCLFAPVTKTIFFVDILLLIQPLDLVYFGKVAVAVYFFPLYTTWWQLDIQGAREFCRIEHGVAQRP